MKNSLARRNLIARQGGEHNHGHAQVLIGLHGRMECQFDDTAGRLASGTVGLAPVEATHRFQGLSDDSELLVIDIAFADPYIASLEAACGISLKETLFQRPEILRLDAGALPLLDFAAARLDRERGQESALLNCQLVSMFMTQLCQLYLGEDTQPSNRSRLDVAELNRIIDRRLGEPPTNAELALALNLSESHFYLLCQRQLGVTPQQYMMKRRLLHARRLLLESQLPLSALALETGFADASSFSRAFKRYFNETPGSIRRGPNNEP